MKKIILFLLFIAVISPAFAQYVKFGVSGGLNESTIVPNDEPAGSSTIASRIAGFHAGVFTDISFGSVSIQPGLFYTTKGDKYKEALNQGVLFTANTSNPSSIANTYYDKQRYNYLQLPVNILYHIQAGGGNFFIGGGPYLAYGLSASSVSYTTTGNGVGGVSSNPISFGSGTNDVKRIDFGLNALGGYALKNGLFVSVGFEYGLTNTDNDYKSRNDVITVSLGYSFL
jgi:hypothetical protein